MRRKPPVPLLVIGAVVAVLVCLPLIYLLIRAFGSGWSPVVDTLARPRTWQAFGVTALLAATVAATTVVIGVPIAWLLTRARLRARSTWTVLVVLPLAVPSFVAAFAWLSFIPGFSGFGAAWLVLAASTLPYVILPTAAALRGIDPAHEEVARTLGIPPVRAFLRASVPQVAAAVGGGALLVALYVLSDFGAVSILRVDTLSRVVYDSYRASFDRTSAATLALLLAVLAMLVVAAEQRARGRSQRWRLATSAPRQPPPVGTGRGPALASHLLLVLVVGIGLAVPVIATLGQMRTGTSARLDVGELSSAVLTTAWYGLIGMVAAVVLAIPVGLLAARYPIPSVRLIERLSFVGHALPGVVVGLGVVFIGIRLFPGLYQTVAILGFAYAVLFVPKAIAATRGSLATVPPILEDVARTCGLSAWAAFRSVTLRLVAPGVGAGAVLVLLTVMKELPATLMLRPTGEHTLATRLWALTEISAYAAAAPYALALVLVGAIPAVVLAVPLARKQNRGDSIGPTGRAELEESSP